MDDIYFSDLPEKKTGGDSPDKFQNDLFSGETEPETPHKFVVHLPESEGGATSDRTPRGKPVESLAPNANKSLPPREKPVISQRRSADDNMRMPEYKPAPAVRQSKITAANAAQEAAQAPRRTAYRAQQNRPAQPGRPTQQPRPASNARRAPQPPKKNRHVAGKVVAVLLAVILVLLLAGAGYAYIVVGKLNFDKDFEDSNPYVSQSELMKSPTVKNILFIGSDARGDVEGQRSDTMLICSIDTLHHKVKLTSLLRDSYVYIPGKDYHTKLNAAFSYGGADLLVDTIEYNFKIKIDDYVLIDFEGFVKLIDSMGGLDVEGVTEAEAKYLRETVKILYAKEGPNHFSGKASLWYCRIRYLDDDFHRTERQRKVIHAIINQALRKGPKKLMEIVDEVMPYITTSMSRNEVPLTAASAVFNFIGGENPQHQIPADETWSNARVNGADVLKFDAEKNIEILKEFIYE